MRLKLSEPYEKRPIRFLEMWQPDDWRIKVYGITYEGETPSSDLIKAARHVAIERLRATAPDTNHYNLGFLGVHEGRGANFVFIGWWADENELHYHVYNNLGDDPERLTYCLPGGPMACVWDAAVISFERQAWVDWILKNPEGPDVEGYLKERLDMKI